MNKKDIFNSRQITDFLEAIIDIREYDLPYHARVMIDLDIRMSFWYKLQFRNGMIDKIELVKDMVDRADMRVLAFDIGN
jgi:DNA polymerase epsilon subunit 1